MRLLLREVAPWIASLDREPVQLNAPVMLLRTRPSAGDDSAWRRRCPNIEIIEITGDHNTYFEPENADSFREAFLISRSLCEGDVRLARRNGQMNDMRPCVRRLLPPYSYANPIVAPAGGSGPLCGVTLSSDLRGRGGGSLGKVLGRNLGRKLPLVYNKESHRHPDLRSGASIMLDLLPYVRRPISTLTAVASDPIESWIRFREQYAAHREGCTPPDLYKAEKGWEARLHDLIGLPSPDEMTSLVQAGAACLASFVNSARLIYLFMTVCTVNVTCALRWIGPGSHCGPTARSLSTIST